MAALFEAISININQMITELNKPKLASKVNFFRLMAVTQKAGLWIRDSIVAIQQWEQDKSMLMILDDMANKLSAWASLAEAMENHLYFFKSDEIELVRSTEITWNMTKTLEELADSLESTQEIDSKVKNASVYPIMMLFFTAAAIVVLLIFVFPTIIDMYWSVDELPWITQFYLKMSDWLMVNWYLLIIWVSAVVIAYNMMYKYWLLFKIGVDKLFLIIPVVSNVTKLYYINKFASLLSQFYSAWVSPVVSFKLLANIFDNFHYKRKMVEIRNSINAWFSIYDSIEWSELFDPILVQIINIWENTWSLPTVLEKITPFYASSLKNNIDALMWVITPLMTVWIAWAVGSLMGAIYLPMADMVNQIW